MAKHLEAMKILAPTENCHKCSKNWWQPNVEPFCWSCFYCGNLIYFQFGDYRQQIDMVCASPRSWEFVKSSSGKGMVPVRDEQLKEIRFQQEMEKKKKTKQQQQKDKEGLGNVVNG